MEYEHIFFIKPEELGLHILLKSRWFSVKEYK